MKAEEPPQCSDSVAEILVGVASGPVCGDVCNLVVRVEGEEVNPAQLEHLRGLVVRHARIVLFACPYGECPVRAYGAAVHVGKDVQVAELVGAVLGMEVPEVALDGVPAAEAPSEDAISHHAVVCHHRLQARLGLADLCEVIGGDRLHCLGVRALHAVVERVEGGARSRSGDAKGGRLGAMRHGRKSGRQCRRPRAHKRAVSSLDIVIARRENRGRSPRSGQGSHFGYVCVCDEVCCRTWFLKAFAMAREAREIYGKGELTRPHRKADR